MFLTTTPVTAETSKNPDVFINGNKVNFDDVSATILNGRTMIPVRKVSKVLANAKVDYKKGNIKIHHGWNLISMNVGNKKVLKNGKSLMMDVEPRILKNRTMVPLRFISEAFDAKVSWNGQTNVVSINNETTIPVLMYHHFSNTISDGNTTIKPSEFREHLQTLKSKGYTTITVDELINNQRGTGILPENPILITMDDGYSSNYEYAFPILKELEMKATIFVVTEEMGKKTYYNPHFSWEQAKEMQVSGFVDIQSHTNDSHYKVGNRALLSSAINGEDTYQYEERIRKDLSKSKDLIEKHLGKESLALAYPYGSYSATTKKVAKEVGFEAAFTVKKGHVYKDSPQYELDRINIPHGLSGNEVIQLIERYAY